MFAGLLLTAGVPCVVQSSATLLNAAAPGWSCRSSSPRSSWSIAISAGINRLSAIGALGLFFVYAALMGVTLSFIFIAYELGSIAAAFVSAAGMFGAAAAYGAITKRSLASIGGYAFHGPDRDRHRVVRQPLPAQQQSISWSSRSSASSSSWAHRVPRPAHRPGDFAAATGSMEKGAVLGALRRCTSTSSTSSCSCCGSWAAGASSSRRLRPARRGVRDADAEPRLTVALTFDHDAISSEVDRGDGPVLRSRGEFGPRVGAPRILALLDREAIPSTWFVPGHTLVTFPDSVAAIVAAGHEIGCHGWAHEDLAAVGPRRRARRHGAQRRGDRARLGSPRRVGFRAPYWSLSERTLELAAESRPPLRLEPDGRRRTGSTGSGPGDVHDARAGSRFGRPGPLVEVPVSWALDDWPHFEPGAKGVGPMSAASKVEEIWTAELRLRLGARAGRPADGHDASRGDRPRPPAAHARAVHRPSPAPSTASSSSGSIASSNGGSPATRLPGLIGSGPAAARPRCAGRPVRRRGASLLAGREFGDRGPGERLPGPEELGQPRPAGSGRA